MGKSQLALFRQETAHGRVLSREATVSIERSFSGEEQEFLQTIRLRLSKEKLNKPFSQHSTIYACVHAIASNVSSLPMKIRSAYKPDGAEREVTKLQTLIDQPNPLMSTEDFFYFVLLWLLLSGECIIVKEGAIGRVTDVTEVPRELWPLNGRLFSLEVNPDTKLVTHYILGKDTPQETVFYPYEVIHIRLPNPYAVYRGMAPLDAAMAAANADWLAHLYNQAFIKNGGDPGGVILMPDKVRFTDDQAREYLSRWDDRHKGDEKSGRIGLLDRGARYESFKQSHKDMEFSTQRTWNRNEIMTAFRCPPGVIGIYEMVNNATAKEESRDFWSKTCMTYVRRIQGALWSGLFRSIIGGRFIGMFDLSGVPELQEDLEKQMNIAKAMKELGYTANQINTRLGLGLPENAWQEHSWTTLGEVPYENLMRDPDFGVNPAVPPDAGAPALPAGGTTEEVQATALNGSQISSLLEILRQVQAGELDADSAKVALKVSFPTLSPDQIDGMIDPIKAKLAEKTPKEDQPEGDPSAPPPPAEEQPKANRESPEEGVARRGKVWNGIAKEFLNPETKRFTGTMRRHFLGMRAEVLANLKSNEGKIKAMVVKAPDIDALLFDPKRWRDALIKSTTPHYRRVTTTAAKRLVKEVAGKTQWNEKDPRIKKLTTSLASNVTGVNDTVRRRLMETLSQGIEKSEGLLELQQRVKDVFNTSSSRALAIARTEVGSATNRARFTAMKFEPDVKQHEWISARDDHVRDAHKDMDGKIVTIGKKFPNGLMMPHDPDAKADQVVNCRCITIPVVDLEAEL